MLRSNGREFAHNVGVTFDAAPLARQPSIARQAIFNVSE
jgi:hypothetical protein